MAYAPKTIDAFAERAVTYNAYRQAQDTVFVALDHVNGKVRGARKPIGWFNVSGESPAVWDCGDTVYRLNYIADETAARASVGRAA